MAPAEVSVLIDVQTLVDGRHDDTVCEYSDGTAIPADTARRHAGDANIIPVVLGGDSRPLDVGRARRLATPPQRTALRAMYRTCAINGCDQHFDRCHIHHIAEWDDLGSTDIDNLIRSAAITTIECTRGDGDCNSTRAPDNSPPVSQMERCVPQRCPTCSPNANTEQAA
jgi:hypothetical protein